LLSGIRSWSRYNASGQWDVVILSNINGTNPSVVKAGTALVQDSHPNPGDQICNSDLQPKHEHAQWRCYGPKHWAISKLPDRLFHTAE